MSENDEAALTGAHNQLAEMLDSGTLNPAALRGIRLQCDLVMARYYHDLPASNGTGGTSLPSFTTLIGALAYKAEREREDGVAYDVGEAGTRYVVRVKERGE